MTPGILAQVRDTADELLMLLPALRGALPKDVVPGDGRAAAAVTAGLPCNTDVLSAMQQLTADCHRAEAQWRSELGDSPVRHTAAETIGSLESLAARFAAMGDQAAARRVAARSSDWLRTVRQVLGFSTPATVIDARLVCPECEESPPLVLSGGQGRLRRSGGAWTVDWTRYEVIRCQACGASWGRGAWPFLGRLLSAAA